jgi:hypothetical protein
MKKAITILLAVIISTASFAQKKDTVPSPTITDSTSLLTLKDMDELSSLMQTKFTVDKLKDFQEIIGWMNARIQARVQEWQRKNQPKKQ